MNILIDINHPAHVHFFRNAIKILENNNHNLIVTSRKKEVATDLLDLYGIEHTCLSTAKPGTIRLGLEMLKREYQLISIFKKEKIDICASITGACTTHVARLFGTPSLVFYDTEPAKLQNAISIPLATRFFTPDCYMNPTTKNQTTYHGTHELAYLHPDYFEPDQTILDELKLKKNDKYVIIRFVAWNATHDKGQKGMSLDFKQKLVETLSQYAKVFIVSESRLPDKLKKFKLPISAHRIHDALAFATLYIGEGVTIAAECACLGTPSIYVNSLRVGYIKKIEKEYHLLFDLNEPLEILEKAKELLKDNDKNKWQQKSHQYINDHINVTKFIVKQIQEYGSKFK